MTDSEVDTETLIALVSSIVNDRLPQIETSSVLDAILRCDGDVESAASYLLQKHTNPVDPKGKKRAHSGLDAWLQRGAPSPKRRKDKERSPEPTDSSLTRPRHSSPAPTLLSILQHHTTNTNTNASSPKKPPSSSSSSSSRKPKPPSSIPRLPPLTLPSPAMVAQHTPCTLHPAVLPPALACRLFYTMLDRARAGWTRNKWWLFERMVESPHRTAFFVRKDLAVKEDADADEWTEAARYWYNGTPTDAPPAFPPEMEEACYIIERVVNAEMRKRKRFDMEWRPPSPPSQSHTSHTSQSDTHPPQADTHPSQSDTREPLWRANVAASNCYEGGKESVGWHSDQLTYLGPCPTIASLSLVKSGEEGDDKIEPSNVRINITFRFYRPDFRPARTPRCRCGVPMILRPDMKNTMGMRDGEMKSRAGGGSGEGGKRKGEGMNGNWNGSKVDGSGEGGEMKYWWTCYAYAQNEGRGCGLWKVMDLQAEGRGWRPRGKDSKDSEDSEEA
ncbi:hypothetical protein EYR38_004558 [Pleurotus pulmonarius]|nr:hypothetical protein EYR38_004558 [Pleurotus pulmonarius]